MSEIGKNESLIKEMQARIDRKLKESEIETVEHWKEQVDRIAAMRPEGVAALQQQVKNISERMNNRLRILRRELSG
jgi:putative protein kinase ArgK-like GTPase of G3E family